MSFDSSATSFLSCQLGILNNSQNRVASVQSVTEHVQQLLKPRKELSQCKAAYKKQPQDVSLNELLRVILISFILASN